MHAALRHIPGGINGSNMMSAVHFLSFQVETHSSQMCCIVHRASYLTSELRSSIPGGSSPVFALVRLRCYLLQQDNPIITKLFRLENN